MEEMTDVTVKDRIVAHRSAPDVYDPPTFEQMANRIEELEAKLEAAEASTDASRTEGRQGMSDDLVKRLQSKIDRQREEIARLTRQVQTLRKENAKLLADVKWMRGEDDD
jgi:predicted RNase H-like nuclease (RuvC/YqgF family)